MHTKVKACTKRQRQANLQVSRQTNKPNFSTLLEIIKKSIFKLNVTEDLFLIDSI